MARTTGSHAGVTGPRVRDAAQRLFARHGFAAVSMRQIAAEVGVQAGALYNYTPDKQSLLADLMQSHLVDVLAAWRVETRGEGPLEALEAFVRFHVRFHLERPEAVFIAYMELRNLDRENFSAVRRLRKDYETELESILIAAQDRGLATVGDVKLTTFAIIAMLTGVNTWFRSGGRLSEKDAEDHYWLLVRNMLRAE